MYLELRSTSCCGLLLVDGDRGYEAPLAPEKAVDGVQGTKNSIQHVMLGTQKLSNWVVGP